MPKIVIIGVGSLSFGPAVLGDLFSFPLHLRESEIWLVDTNEESLWTMGRYAGKINQSQGELFDIRVTTDRREALPNADFVIVSVAVDRLKTWKLDWQIPLKHGVRHVLGENGGPGGLSHALRNIPLLLNIAQDVEQLAPKALLLNFTNPMSRLCMALHQNTQVNFVGLCHQIGEGYRLVNKALGLVKESGDSRQDARNIERRIHIKAAGLNHFTFMLDIRDKRSGENLYPRLREKLAAMPADFELMSRRMFDTFGLFCATGDEHAGEYVGFASETIPIKGFDFDAYERRGREQWEKIRAIAEIDDPRQLGNMGDVVSLSGERAIQIINAITHDLNQHELSVNIPNAGLIANLSNKAIVEVPATIDANGIRGEVVGALPIGLAAIMQREITIQELVVDAAVNGDRKAALQALLLDPHIHSYAQATHLLDDLLSAQKNYLPNFI
jgi:alpha-galactosidase